MEETKKLMRNIHRIMYNKVTNEALAQSFIEYIKAKKKLVITAFNNKIEKNWFKDNEEYLKKIKKQHIDIYDQLLKKLKRNNEYIPSYKESKEINDIYIKQYVEVKNALRLFDDKEFKNCMGQYDVWNDQYIKEGPFKKFVNGLINYALKTVGGKNYLDKNYLDIEGVNGIITALAKGGADPDLADICRDIVIQYVKISDEEKLEYYLSKNKDLDILNIKVAAILTNSQQIMQNTKLKTDEKFHKIGNIIGKQITANNTSYKLFQHLTAGDKMTPDELMKKLRQIQSACQKLINKKK